MATDLIRYDLLYQDAMRGIVRKVMSDAAREGLPGEHHFFISFRTHGPGVRLSARLRKQYPDTMTIVLQHQFWGLSVGDQAFDVGLSFQGEAETLHIPFDAIVGFFDPSVDFGLKIMLETEVEPEAGKTPAVKLVEPAPKSAQIAEKAKPRGSGTEPVVVDPTRKIEDQPAAEEKPAAQQSAEAKVVSLETFRKKP
ncbi:MAG: SspB family protein [Beijerinckiaceae bacterium]